MTETGHQSAAWLIVYVAAIVMVLCVLRYVWVWLSLNLTLLRVRRRQGEVHVSSPRRITAAMSVAGARGAVTLAGALTIPLTLDNGAPFPARDLVIFLACCVILASLVIAALGLPVLLRGLRLPEDSGEDAARDHARVVGAQAAIAAIEEAGHRMAARSGDVDRYTDIAARLMDQYRDRIDALSDDRPERDPRDGTIERGLHLTALAAERQAIYQLAQRGEIGLSLAEQLVRDLDWTEGRVRALPVS